MLDENEIRQLASSYSDAITDLDATRAASVYMDDGSVLIAGRELAGRAAIESGLRDTLAAFSLLQLIQHAGIVELDGDQARARWSTIELAVRKDRSQVNLIFGRYSDLLLRRPEGWKFKRREFILSGRCQVESSKFQLSARS